MRGSKDHALIMPNCRIKCYLSAFPHLKPKQYLNIEYHAINFNTEIIKNNSCNNIAISGNGALYLANWPQFCDPSLKIGKIGSFMDNIHSLIWVCTFSLTHNKLQTRPLKCIPLCELHTWIFMKPEFGQDESTKIIDSNFVLMLLPELINTNEPHRSCRVCITRAPTIAHKMTMWLYPFCQVCCNRSRECIVLSIPVFTACKSDNY